MSFGVSLSDFAKAAELALSLYRTCFTKAERADIKYAQFGEEIHSLANSLKELANVLASAGSLCPGGPWSDDSVPIKVLSQVTGDFLRTLQDCECLLNDNSKFKRTTANFIDNVVWHSSTERDVNSLRQRVHFHQTKIDFNAKPLRYRLLVDIDRQLQDIGRDVAEIKGTLDHRKVPAPENSGSISTTEGYLALPQDLASRLTEALSVNQPGSFQVQDDLPLKEGFDTVVFHLDKSTVTLRPNPVRGQHEADPPRFLNLLKSRWILEKLKGSANLQSAGPESVWAVHRQELEDQIQRQLDRFKREELTAPSRNVLSELPDSCFDIWVDQGPPLHPIALTDERPLEEKILELELNNQYPKGQSTIATFRKSDVVFRLVSTTNDEQNNSFYRESVVNMAHTRLIPNFAPSKDSCNANYSLYYCQNHIQPYCYTFRDPESVREFQRALLGYRVSHDASNTKWCIEFQAFCKRGMSGNATLQLWHLKPLSKNLPYSKPLPLGNHNSSTVSGARSHSRSTERRGFNQSATSRPPGSAIESRVSGPCGDGIALLRPEPPVLVIFTECEKRYSFLPPPIYGKKSMHVLYTLLTNTPWKSMFWQRSKLVLNAGTKRRHVHESSSKATPKILSFRRLRAEQNSEQGLNSWDLAFFRHPEHPRFRDLEKLCKVKYMSLHFVDQESQCLTLAFFYHRTD
ncbi:MAG: hypothetical protein Q9225_003103 [Loekoesia sp. 1 TL-2023]